MLATTRPAVVLLAATCGGPPIDRPSGATDATTFAGGTSTGSSSTDAPQRDDGASSTAHEESSSSTGDGSSTTAQETDDGEGEQPCVPTRTGSGVDLHVDAAAKPGGSGTSDAPFSTLAEAIAIVGPGDTILVHPGTYTGDAQLVGWIEVDGTEEEPIVIRSTERWAAKLDGRDNATASGFGIYGSHVTLEGFDIFGFAETGVYSYGDAATIRGNHIHHIGRMCTDDAGGLDAIVVSGAGIVVDGNFIHDIGRFAPGEAGCQPLTPYYMNHDHGIYVESCTDVAIHSNVLLGIARGWGVHVYAGAGDGTTGMLLAHNTFVGPNPYNAGHVILASPWVADADIVDNVFADPLTAAVVTWEVDLDGVTMTNNLTTADTLVVGEEAADVVAAGNLMQTDPGFVDAAAVNHRLAEGSLAVDAGAPTPAVAQDFDGACRPIGGAPDIGAFERAAAE